MKRRIPLEVFVLMIGMLIPIDPAWAANTIGPGGGGFVMSGAFQPGNPNTVVIGTDNGGVFRSGDYGESWKVWNHGLWHKDESATFYVEDLIGATWNSGTKEGFVAATRGGIFYREAGLASDDWSLLTPGSSFNYYDVDRTATCAMPFSCLDVTDDGVLYAGAGYARFLGASVDLAGHHVVWYQSLSGTPSPAGWNSIPSDDFVTVRDISAQLISGITYVAVATPGGVRLWNDDTETWNTVAPQLDCWSVHITERGTLYAAFEAGAVRRIANITTGNLIWHTVDQADPENSYGPPPACTSISEIDRLGILTVYDGAYNSTEDDILYLTGLPSNDKHGGLFRCALDGTQDISPTLYWKHWIYRKFNLPSPCGSAQISGGFYYAKNNSGDNGNGDPELLDIGYISEFAVGGRHHPIVCSSDPDRVIMQLEPRLHIYKNDQGQDEWVQSYTTDVSENNGEWKGLGYNQNAVRSVDFMPAPPGSQNGVQVLASTVDLGLFISTPDNRLAFTRHNPPRDIFPNDQNFPEADVAWTWAADDVEFREDWFGQDAIFLVTGDVLHNTRPGKVFRWADDALEWVNITAGTETQLGFDQDKILFETFAFAGDGTIFIGYTRFEQFMPTTPSSSNNVVENGVIRGTTTDGINWTWKRINTGLADNTYNRFPGDLLYQEDTGKIFMAAERRKVSGLHQTGALLYLSSVTDTTWEVVLDGSTTPSLYRDWRTLAQSSDGTMMYAGTNGRSDGFGAVLRCDREECDCDCDSPGDWESITTGMPFEFDPSMASPWTDLQDANDHLLHVQSLTVKPSDKTVVVAGVFGYYNLPQMGPWVYNRDGNEEWNRMPVPGPVQGIRPHAVEFYPALNQVMVGTGGNGLYNATLRVGTAGGGFFGKAAVDEGVKRITLGHAPNPFNPTTKIRFELPAAGRVRLDVYSVAGELVTTLRNGRMDAGTHQVTWNGTNSTGQEVGSGVYFYRLDTAQGSETRKMTIIR